MAFLDYAHRGRNAGWRYLLGMVLGPFFALALGAVLLIPATLYHLLPDDIGSQLTQVKDPWVFFPTTAVLFGLFLGGYGLAVIIAHQKSPLDLLGRWSWKNYALGAGLWLAYLGLCTAIEFGITPGGFHLSPAPPSLNLALVVIMALAVQTFAEEYVFRGYLTQGLLLGLKSPYLASIVCGLAFGALHIPNGGPQALSAVVFGIGLSIIAIRTGNLAFGSGLHLVNNTYGAVIIVSEQDVFKGSPGFFYQNTPQLSGWDLGLGLGGIALTALAVSRFGQSQPTTIALKAET
ncbi:MAG: hypothetical protein CGW95_02300 [Phenylobacterium zucineum]|nr:MAG: hypothetical protein CGW95_02300 [Phenylobacterium zucineum]